MDSSYLTPKQLAKRWKVKVATLRQWRWNGKGPLYSKVGKRILYWPHDINAFEKSKRRRHTSDLNIYSNDGFSEQKQTAGKSPRKLLSAL
jgi:predicted site-specific integrase-resolvase